MYLRRPLAITAAALLPAAPAQAAAATIGVDFTQSPSVLRYNAASGQQNTVTLTMVGGEFVVSDPAGIDPGEHCRRIGADNTRVACSWTYRAVFGLGDGDDRFDATGFGAGQPAVTVGATARTGCSAARAPTSSLGSAAPTTSTATAATTSSTPAPATAPDAPTSAITPCWAGPGTTGVRVSRRINCNP